MIVGNLADATCTRFKSISERNSVQAAADAFSDSRLGLIVICDEAERLCGVVSKSDLVRHIAEAGRIDAPIAAVMSRSIVSGMQSDDLRSAWELMAARRLQNLPLLGSNRKPVGTLDIRDALQAILTIEQEQEAQLINYISGVGYR